MMIRDAIRLFDAHCYSPSNSGVQPVIRFPAGMAVLSALALTIGTGGVAKADCPYRTTTPQGQITSSLAPENSVACVAQPSPDCPQCQPGVQHECVGGSWLPIEGASCGGGPQLAARPQAQSGASPGGQTASRSGAEERCIYYDKDRRRLELSPEDRAWAEEAGLVADKKCY